MIYAGPYADRYHGQERTYAARDEQAERIVVALSGEWTAACGDFSSKPGMKWWGFRCAFTTPKGQSKCVGGAVVDRVISKTPAVCAQPGDSVLRGRLRRGVSPHGHRRFVATYQRGETPNPACAATSR